MYEHYPINPILLKSMQLSRAGHRLMFDNSLLHGVYVRKLYVLSILTIAGGAGGEDPSLCVDWWLVQLSGHKKLSGIV